MIEVMKMSGLVTVQDLGRPGYAASGVARGGAMDRESLADANSLVGNNVGSAALEWAIGGGSIQFSEDATVAIAGAEVEAEKNGVAFSLRTPVRVRAGETITVHRIVRGRFAYLGVAGGIEVPILLGSRSTHLSAGFGGYEGRRLRGGDKLAVARGDLAASAAIRPMGPASDVIRAIELETRAFSGQTGSDFWSGEFVVSSASDRTGYRLTGPGMVTPGGGGMMTSEPACPGTIQIPPGGEPVVLMVEGPTVGGYAKIGAVASVDLGRLAQKQPGENVRFERIGIAEAQRLAGAAALADSGC